VCLIRAVEPCMSFQVHKSHVTHRLEISYRERQCLHHDLYLIDPEFGFMHIRIQGWLPYECQVYINGREWLARQLDRAGVGYVRYENSLLAIDNLEAASSLCERFAHRAWPRVLNAFARRMNPMLAVLGAAGFGGYHWVLDQAEIATDVMFKSRPQLAEIWPDVVRHAALNMSSADVLGFLGRKLHPSLKAQVLTEAKRRPEGWRVKHRVAGNWVKVYDKASVLRVETTINNWCPMRKGVSDCWRNFQVGMAANRHYLEALAAAPLKGEGVAGRDALCRPKTNQGRRYARFNPLLPADLALFKAVLAGEHAIRGFRNRDICARLYRRPAADKDESHRRCERVSRLIVKLRGHGLVPKVPRARRYRVTRYGHQVMTAAIALHDHTYPLEYRSAA
jgi:hypothetical protein